MLYKISYVLCNNYVFAFFIKDLEVYKSISFIKYKMAISSFPIKIIFS